MSESTDQAVADRLRQILQGWGKVLVIVRKDVPGQLANRILQTGIREATAIVESGVASAEDTDTAVKMGMGPRFPTWGPLEHVDTVGLELCASGQQTWCPASTTNRVPFRLAARYFMAPTVTLAMNLSR
jgi:3-hydroxybutyryl-CoA dehydrogenase